MSQPVDTHNTEPCQWAAGCKAWVLHNSAASTVKEEYMAAGTREQLHLHQKTEQFFYILEGRATLYLDNNATLLTTGQGLCIPAGTAHYIANDTGQPLRFLVISAPGLQTVNGTADRINL